MLDGDQMGVREPFLDKLVGTVAELIKTLSRAWRNRAGGGRLIEKEEANFLVTLDTGLIRIERIFSETKSQHRGIVSAAEAADILCVRIPSRDSQG